MSASAIFLPAVAMVALTIAVLFQMFFERRRQVLAEAIHMREIPSSSQMASRFVDTRGADNYRNLFEMPVLFYVALVVAFVTSQVTPLVLGLAWGYVAFRVLHSFIHCTYNRVMHRFYAFLASNVLLWTMWGVLSVGLLRSA
ncbi:MAG: MAPEG family protein [Pseudomonadota bacterium]|nr:MAPEG family protein [Pseudomonadota bacterium]